MKNDDQLSEKDILEMTCRIVAAANPVKVILFGSRARQTARSGSDVDLLVIERDPVAQHQESVRLMSSVTVLFVLARFLASQAPTGDYGVMMAPGPGFSAE